MHTITATGKVGRVTPLKKVGDNHVLNFTLASNEYKSANGEKRVVWFNCSLWGKHAENIHTWIIVGKGLSIVGKLIGDEHGNPEVYETQDGEPRASFKVNVNEVEFTSPAGEKKAEDDDDDIPF